MELQQAHFGEIEETPIDIYTLSKPGELTVKLISLGATLVSVEMPDRQARQQNITLSLNSLEEYQREHPYLGSMIGRYANRIARGKFI